MTTSKIDNKTATIGEYADYYHESDFLPPPEGWIEVRSHMPGVTRAFVPPPTAAEESEDG